MCINLSRSCTYRINDVDLQASKLEMRTIAGKNTHDPGNQDGAGQFRLDNPTNQLARTPAFQAVIRIPGRPVQL